MSTILVTDIATATDTPVIANSMSISDAGSGTDTTVGSQEIDSMTLTLATQSITFAIVGGDIQ